MNSVFQEKNTDRKDWKIAYVNPNLINQSMINPQINEKDNAYKDNTSQELHRIKADMTSAARIMVADYLSRCFMKWQDRQCIMSLYNFE